MRTILFVILFGLFVTGAEAQDFAKAIKKAANSIVYVEPLDGSGGCTGFVVNKTEKYVMTAAHCDNDSGKGVLLDRVKGEIIAKDSKKDVMIFYVKHLDPNKEDLYFANKNPSIGDEVVSAGFGYALERPFFRKSMVSDDAVMIPEEGIGGPFIGVDSGFIGGQSGGPVVNVNGEVVSIVQRASDKLGIGVGAEIIRERMGRFLAIPVVKTGTK
jgi:S1-C subfamily serine protease